MAIMDKKLELADNQAMSANNTQLALTNVLDLGNLSAKDLAIGPGTPLYLNIRIVRAVTGHPTTWDTSCSFKVQQGASAVYNVASARYLRLLFSKNGSTAKALTAGSVDAWISGATPETNVGT
jgi:hypothetical protein